MLQKKFVEKITTHILGLIIFFSENRALYEITWKIIVQPDRPERTTWRIRIACWIPKAKNTHSTICNTHCFSTATVVAEHPSILRYTYIAYLP